MSRRDYYAILGVERSVGADELKKAFRALAMQYHPDRNPEDPDAERRFREVMEAWEVLGDPEQRMRYDRLGPFFRTDGRPPTPEDVSVVVGEALAGIFRRRPAPERGEDLRYQLGLSLEEAALGVERTIEVRRFGPCRRCAGSGAEPGEGSRVCDQCNGEGRTGGRLLKTECPRCDGRGHVIVQRCGSCEGKGRVETTDTLKVHIPSGVATGQKLKVRGKGNLPRRGVGKPGDLYVLIEVMEHELFHRRGSDLLCEVPITFTEAALGADVMVPTLDGTTAIRVPPGTPSGQTFRLGGRGLPSPGDRAARGDLHYRVVVEVPDRLGEAERRLLGELAGRLSASSHPRREAFEARLKERKA